MRARVTPPDWHPRAPASLQLTVLGGPPVDAAAQGRAGVAFLLAIYAELHAGDCAPARLGDRLLAFGAMRQALAHGAAPRLQSLQFIRDRGLDLILHRAIARPAASHDMPSLDRISPCDRNRSRPAQPCPA